MECPICGCNRVQYRSKNNKTLVTKYKCIDCKQVFEVKEQPINSSESLINQINQVKKENEKKEKQGDKNENSNHRRFTSVI